MNLAEQIINKLGISTTVLAKLIDAGQSHMHKHVSGLRSVPAAALPKLAMLYAHVEKLPDPLPQAINGDDIKKLQQNADSCRIDAMLLQKKLDAMLLQFQQAAALLQVLELHFTPQTDLPEKAPVFGRTRISGTKEATVKQPDKSNSITGTHKGFETRG